MLLSWLSKTLSSLLVVVLASATVTTVLNQTLLSSHYIEGKLASTDSYNRLSVALTDQISKQDSLAANPEVTAKISAVLTPAALQAKINGALDQFQNYYRGDGPPPVIDLTDLAAQAQAAGIPIGEDSGLTKPIPLSTNSNGKSASKTYGQVGMVSVIASGVLIVALLAISWKRGRYVALPDVLIAVGIFVGLLALAFVLASNMLTNHIKLDTASNAFAPIARDLASTIMADLAKRLGVAAALYTAVGIAARIWVAKLGPKAPAKPVLKPGLKPVV